MDTSERTVKRVLPTIRAKLRSVLSRSPEWSPEEMADYVPELDRVLRRIFEELDALRRYLFLKGTPRRRPFNVLDWARIQSAHRIRTTDSLQPSRPERCTGDVERMSECLRLVLRNLAPLAREPLGTRLYLGGPKARIEMGFDNQAIALETISLGPNLEMSLPEFARCWSGATGGGRVLYGSEAVILYFSGHEPPDPPDRTADSLHRAIHKAAQGLAPWRGAIGHFEEGVVANSQLASLYMDSIAKTLAHIETALHELDA